MCEPATIAALALSAGSALANNMAQQKAAKAQDRVMAAERIRQNRFDQEAAALNTQSQDRYKDFEGTQGETANDLAQYFQGQQAQAADAAGVGARDLLPASSSNLVVRDEGQKRDLADAFSDRQGAALGNLRAFGQTIGDVGRLQARDASQIGQIGGFKRGSAGILPMELDRASQAGNGMKAFADVLNLASAGVGGMKNTSLFGSTPTVTAAPAYDPWSGFRSTGSIYKNKGGLY